MSRGESRRAELLDRRRRLLGPAYRHFYEDPVEVVRGEGVHLFDADGVEYLDAYNNVPCVGHAHPRVVAAICEQAKTLNTHTRYLAEPILDYSQRLLDTLEPPLEHVMFTCSGSEATDLALRVARLETGRQGIVVTANAYHGVTTAAAEISPSLGPSLAPGPSVRTISTPTPGDERPTDGDLMARELSAAIDDLDAKGLGFAAFICDSLFASDGIVPGPQGLLRPLVDEVHAHGGLFIADEVQAGFARTGEEMWGFHRHAVTPDIVAMGKPMGNGMPVAAVASRPDLLERFGSESRFFSTFGGNSLGIAAATAVLDVIEDERLAANATAVGAYLRSGLRGLEERYSMFRGVRGAGLFIGATVIDGAGRSDRAADRILNRMRSQGVLIGITGSNGDMLKIRPPLVFSRDDADRLLASLASALDEECDE